MAIDIGIKHLAYCVARAGPDGLVIQSWSVVNLVSMDDHDNDPMRCARCTRCGKPATARATSGVVCTRHIPRDRPLLVDAVTGKPLRRVGCAPLRAFLASRGLRTSGNLPALTDRVLPYATIPIVRTTTAARHARAFAMDTNRLHDAIRRWIDRDWSAMRDVTRVLIEQQPVLKNPTMKTVQLLVYATLRERLLQARSDASGTVAFHQVHASTKVKGCGGDGTGDGGYTTRKAYAQARVRRFLSESPAASTHREWGAWLSTQPKTDDLSDALCMLLDDSDANTMPAAPTDART